MGLRINTNVASLAAQNKLSQTTKKLSGTLQRLSTGLRINNASDDVVGLFKSESLRSNIRGIATAEQNISSASSTLGIAEGSLSELTDIAQSIREKIVQAADATISTNDRTNIATSINDLLSEYSRLVLATEFNGVKLLDGTFSNKNFQVGYGVSDQISTSILDTRSSAVGSGAIMTIAALTITTTSAVDFADIGLVTIGGVQIQASSFAADGVSSVQNNNSAIAIANAINTNAGGSGVTATALATVVTFAYSAGNTAASGTQTYTLNGVTLVTGFAADTDTSSDANATTLAAAINAVTAQTGVTATIDTSTNAIQLNASDGRNITFASTLSAGASVTNVFGVAVVSTAAAVNAGYRGAVRLFSDNTFSISDGGTSIAPSTATSIATTTTNLTLNSVNVSSVTNAQTGLFILDNVIRQIQTRRTNVGSKVNRFETALKEIQSRKENLSSAESIIRDADIAKETADLTSRQVLQQAGVQVLARANSLPQIALELLRAGQ